MRRRAFVCCGRGRSLFRGVRDRALGRLKEDDGTASWMSLRISWPSPGPMSWSSGAGLEEDEACSREDKI